MVLRAAHAVPPTREVHPVTPALARLWDDDQGAVVSTELVLVLGVLIFGIIPGLVALRNSVIAALTTIGNFLTRLTPTITYSGYAVVGVGGISTVAAVGGLRIDYTTTVQLTGDQLAPVNTDFLYPGPVNVEPAP
jgi:Flp pilus assembly pilin Flp